MQADSAEADQQEGFSPLRVARAGRRAGRHVAITEPDGSSTAAPTPPTTQETGPGLQQQDYSAAADTTSVAMQPGHEQLVQEPPPPVNSQQQPQTQLVQPEQPQQSRQAAQVPPVKRVGFSLEGAVAGAGSDGVATSGQQQQQNFSGVSRRKQEQLQREEQSQAKLRNKCDERVVDALADVPELEEVGKEDITRMVAQAPKAAAPAVQAISELESDQAWMPAQPARSTDINLSLLTSCLLPSAQVVEPADVWDYSLLFAQLKAELQNDVAQGGAGGSADGGGVSGSGGGSGTNTLDDLTPA